MDDEILSFKEAMAFLKIPRSSLYKLVQEGNVPAMKVGRHWRFSKKTLQNWLQGNAENSVSQNHNNSERQYCWQFHQKEIGINHECVSCIAYKSRTLNCYVLRDQVDPSFVHCKRNCKDCEYFRKYFD